MSTNWVPRLVRLAAGLVLFGVSLALLVRARLGLPAWDVLHQGLAHRTGLSFGMVINAVAVAVLLLWIPLRQRPGFGTLANVVVVGLSADAALAVLPPAGWLPAQVGLLLAGVVLNGIATGLYLGARLGPGPRDGLMTGLAARGHSIRVVRTGIELAVLAVGWLLGGTVGVGTVLYAVAIGPLAHYFIPRLELPARVPTVGATASCPN
ncbi:MAG TPA: hypothetical protein VF462_00950 [Micromonosporaceae bacterium]